MERPLDMETMAWFGRIPGRVTIGGAMPGQVRVAGEVRRLTFVPDGADGELIAELCDGTGELHVHLPRRCTSAWAPGALLAVDGTLWRRSLAEPRRLQATTFAPVDVGVSERLDWIGVTPAGRPVTHALNV
jgi:hypothetical protein